MNANTHLNDLSLRLLGRAFAELDAQERRVVEAIAARAPSSRDAADIGDAQASIGDRLADKVAAVGGSWGFIIVFALVLLGWMLLNSEVLQRFGLAFDPYPFIFLNLMLSTLAAVQAPIIMMSQNRQAAKDRLTASVERGELQLREVNSTLTGALQDHDTIQEDQDTLRALSEAIRSDVDRARRALLRVADGTYGICRGCGGSIAAERLDAIPTAERCARCA